MNCGCACHVPTTCEGMCCGDDNEVSDFECPDCSEELEDDGTCGNEECDSFECDPYEGGGTYVDEQKWERQQMGITD